MIKLINVNKDYKISHGKVHALENVNITFPDTGFYSIIGRSGSGKTTILNCIAEIDKVTSGEIYYNNINICKLKNKKLDNYRQEIGFIFQDYNLLREYNVEQNIATALTIQGVSKEEINVIVNDTLKKVGLEGYNKRKIIELSGGEQQRVVIARVIAKKSKVIFCDEPTGNLDEDTAIEIFSLLKELSKELLVINVTHNNDLAKMFSDGIVEIQKGNVINNSIQDITYSNNEDDSNNIINKTENKIGFKFISKLCFEHFKHLKILSLIILLIFICSFTVFTIFYSVSNFSKTKAMIATMKANDQTLIQATNCREYVEKRETKRSEIIVSSSIEYDEDEEIYYIYDYGLETNYKKITEEERQKISDDLSGKATIYKSYTYLKSFETLFGIKNPYRGKSSKFVYKIYAAEPFYYHAFEFEEMIAIKDFSNFRMPLLYGSNPKEDNEVLIYDYMADNLIFHKAFNCEMKELIGKTIYDKSQDIEFKIAGIIKSNYKYYEYLNGSYSLRNATYGQVYLNSLKCIYVSESLIDKINNNILSIYDFKYSRFDIESEEYIYIEDSNIDKIVGFSDDNINYLYKFDYEEDIYIDSYANIGVVLTVSQVLKMFGIEELSYVETIKYIYDYFNAIEELEYYINEPLDFSYHQNYYNGINMYYSETGYCTKLYGVVSDDTFNDNNSIHICSLNNQYPPGFDKTELNSLYIGLNSDYSYAEDVIDYFTFTYHSDNYYEDCLKKEYYFSNEGFCINDSVNLLISEAGDYLEELKASARLAAILSIIIIIVSIGGLCLLSMKKQVYKIGIFKSLGAKNFQLELSYILYASILASLACIMSFPVSYLVMAKINGTFFDMINGVRLIMFTISFKAILYTLLSTFIISLLTSFATYIVFTIKPPVMLIRRNKDI